MKVGQTLYRVMTDEEDGTVETMEYVVRIIRAGKVFATMKASHVTVDTKGNWLKSIPDWCRVWWYAEVTDTTPHYCRRPADICNSKKAAARAALKLHRPGDFDDPKMAEKAGRTLKRMAA